jgi:hypothetical protein
MRPCATFTRTAAALACALLPLSAPAQGSAPPETSAPPPPAHEHPETIQITPWTAAEFGGEGGDALTLERLTSTGAVVLLNPHDENCTLRISMRLGEHLVVRGATIDGKQAVCKLLLSTTTQDVTAIFSYECLDQSPVAEKRCTQ